MPIENINIIRFVVFVSTLLILISLQWLLPKRSWKVKERFRVSVINISMVILGTVAIRLLVPISLIALANYVQVAKIGLLSHIDIPYLILVIVSIIALDCIIYWQHRLFHILPWFWRIHRMHHADTELGTTTGIRFHPVEFILSYLLKIFAIGILGIDALSVFIFEILLNATSLWNHSNIAIPKWLDGCLRWVLVTPDMHRVHHSVHTREHNTNFGFCLSIWDRMFFSYIDQPQDGHSQMQIGLQNFRNRSDQGFINLLLLPFRHP